MPGIDHLIRTDFKEVDKRDEVGSVLSYLTGGTAKPPIITDDERPVGIVNDRALMRRRFDTAAHLEGFLNATRAVTPDAKMDDVVQRMLTHRAAYLPVEDAKGKTKGYVRALDVAKELDLGGNAGSAAVRVEPLREDQTLGDALHLFAKEYLDHLPVVDASGRVTGVLSRSVLLALGAATGRTKGRKDANPNPIDPLDMPVSGHLESAFETVGIDTAAPEVLETVERFGHAVVLDRTGRFYGIVTDETILQGAAPAAPTGEALPAPVSRERRAPYQYRRQS